LGANQNATWCYGSGGVAVLTLQGTWTKAT
jgi:hypothetical protein